MKSTQHLIRALLIAVVWTVLFAGSVSARMLEGQVVAIADGDTILVRTDDAFLKLRLVYVDAPELDQPYGRSARWALRTLLNHKKVRFQTLGRDRFERTLALVTRLPDNLDVNYELVARGHAWANTRSDSKERYAEAEEKARSAHLGLWRDSHPVRPATWRKNHQQKRQT